MKKIKSIYICLLFIALFAIALQTATHLVPERRVYGVEIENLLPKFTVHDFINAIYQEGIERYVAQRIGFRGNVVRLENQINFTFFKEISSSYPTKIILGKENILFESPYIATFNKLDVITPGDMEKQVERLKRLQDKLRDRGIIFLFIVTPNKASIYPEYIPDQYILKSNRTIKSNYDNLISLLPKYKILYLDGHAYFVSLKEHLDYPLFCKGGTHWSNYAAFLFLQTIIDTLENKTNKNLIKLISKNIELTDKARSADDDLATLTNVYFKKSFSDKEYVYPIIEADPDIQKKFRPKVLDVGGSFLFNLHYYLDENKWYRERTCYFYYSTNYHYPDNTLTPVNKDKSSLAKTISSSDIVILEANEQGLVNIGCGFVEDAILALEQYKK